MIVNAYKWWKALPEDFDPKTGRYNGEDTTGKTQRGDPKGRPKGGKTQRENDAK